MHIPSAAHRRLIRRRLLANLEAITPPRAMKKKKPKKSKSPASKSASKTSPSKDSPVKSVDYDSDSPHSEFVSDAHNDIHADVVAQLPLVSSDLDSPPVPPSDQVVIVDSLTDPSGKTEVDLPIVSSSDKTVIADPSADPSSVQEVIPMILLESSSVIQTTCSSVLPSNSLQTTNDGSHLEPAVQAPIAEAEKKSSCSHLAEALDNTVTPSVVPEEGVVPSYKDKLIKPVPTATSSDTWCDHAKGVGKRLSKKGEPFTLPSGEACIQIPNSVIEKHRKSWEPFVIGQFYSDPPSQGTLHNIVNGIWSKQYRDIAVSKMEGFSFLFRIPHAATRSRVIKQKLWQIEGQTMFVDKWEPGTVPEKPELTSAPIWLELRKVPFQFFNEDGLERIAGLVGHPKFLHPTTANKTNLEVAKVFTIIDPRKPLPEAVNVQFQSGEISRVLVSCPWMPPVCETCKEIGHISKRCPQLPKACSLCKSTEHASINCPAKSKQETRGRKTRRSKSRGKQKWVVAAPPIPSQQQDQADKLGTDGILVSHKGDPHIQNCHLELSLQTKLGTREDRAVGESSGARATPPEATPHLKAALQRSGSRTSHASHSDVQPDSSDVESSDPELEEGEFSMHEPDFEVVRPRKVFSGRKGKRGSGPNIN